MSDYDSKFDFSQFDDYESPDAKLKVPGKVYNSKSDRSPARSAGRFVTSSLTSGLGSAGKAIDREVNRNFGRTRAVTGEALQVVSDIDRLRSEVMRDAAPLAAQTKSVARRLLTQARPYVPSTLYKKIDDRLRNINEYRSGPIDQSKAEQAIVDSSIDRIFAEQQSIEEERRQIDEKKEIVEKQMDRSLTFSRHKDLINALEHIRAPMQLMGGFFKTIYPAYLKESLKIQYKTYFLTQKQLETSQVMASILETKLEGIMQNTALPDIQKQTKMESMKENLRQRVSQRLNSSLANWGGTIVNNVRQRVFDPAKQAMDMYGSVLGMLDQQMDMSEMDAEMGIPKPGMAQSLGGVFGKLLGRTVGAEASKRFLQKYAPFVRGTEDIAKIAKTRAAVTARDRYEEGHGGVKGLILELLNPNMRSHAGRLSNVLMTDPTAAASLDVATKTSINEIIPGMLARIEQNTRSISTGRPAEELVFDPKTRDFVSVSQYRRTAFTDMFGTKEERTRHVAEGLSTLRASASHHGYELTDFNKLNSEITKVLANHSTRAQRIYPEAIKEVAETGIIEGKYKALAFAGIKNPKEVAEVLVRSLYIDGNRLDGQAVAKLEDYIFYSMSRDEYLDKFTAIADVFGSSRHFKDLFRDEIAMDGTRTFDSNVIGKLRFGDLDLGLLKDDVTSQTQTLRRAFDSMATGKGTVGGPEWLQKVLVKATGEYMSSGELSKRSPGAFDPSNMYAGVGRKPSTSGGRGLRTPADTMYGNSDNYPIEVLLDELKSSNNLGSGEAIVASVNQFERSFNAYVSDQMVHMGGFKSVLDDISNNILNLNILQSIPEEDKASGKTSGPGTLWSGGKAIVGRAFKSGIDATKWYVDKGLSAARMTSDSMLGLGKLGLSAVKGLGLPALGMGGRGLLNVFDRYVSLSGTMAKAGGSVIKGAMDFLRPRGGTPRLAKFVDIYLKGEIDLGRPLLSKRQQERGVVFADGKPVESSHDIDRPVLDPKTGDVLITEEDIRQGLVTKYGVALDKAKAAAEDLIDAGRRGGGGLLGSLFKGGGKLAGGIGSILGGQYGKLFDFSLEGMKGIGKLGSGLISKMFGLGGSTSKVIEKTLEDRIGARLDKIYELLDETIGWRYRRDSTDHDGDGLREGSWQSKDKAKQERSQTSTTEELTKSLRGGKGLWGAAGGLLGSLFRKRKQAPSDESSEDSDDSGFGVTDFAQYWLLDKVFGKVGGRVGKVFKGAKALGGKAFGGIGKGLAKLGSMIGMGALSTLGKGMPTVMTTVGGSFATATGLTAATSAAASSIGGVGAAGSAAAGIGVATATTKAATAASGGKLGKILKTLVSKLPDKFAKVIKLDVILKAIQKGGSAASAKILSRFSLGPFAWVIVVPSMVYAATQGYLHASEILGYPDELLGVWDKCVVGAAAAVCDGLFLDLLGIISVKELAELLGAGKSAKAQIERDEKTASDINVETKADESEIAKRTEVEVEGDIRRFNELKVESETKGSMIQRMMDSAFKRAPVLSTLKWLSYPIMHPETTSRWIYNWFGTEDWNKECQSARAKAYGIDLKHSYGAWTNGKDIMLKLESRVDETLSEGNVFSEKDLARMSGWFNLNGSTEEIKYWTTWFYQKFTPIFKAFTELLQSYGCTYANHEYKFPVEKADELLRTFNNFVKDKESAYRSLIPTEQGFKEFSATLDKINKEIEEGKAGVSYSAVFDSINAKDNTEKLMAKTNKYHSDATTYEALRRQNDIQSVTPTPTFESRAGKDARHVSDTLGRAVSVMDPSTTIGATVTGGKVVPTSGAGKRGTVDDVPTANGTGWDAVGPTIVAAAELTGVDPAVMAAMAYVESKFDPNAKATGSSASGLFQFTKGTWAEMLKKYGGKYGLGPDASPMDPRANALMGGEYLKENERYLKSKLKGRSISDTDLYMSHFLGAGGAASFLSANPNAIAEMVNPKAARSNPGIFYHKSGKPRTVAEVYELLDSRLQEGRTRSSNAKSLATTRYSSSDTGVATDLGSAVSMSSVSTKSSVTPVVPGITAPSAVYQAGDEDKVHSPAASNIVTSPFGPRNIAKGSKNHRGIDMRAHLGTPINAIMSGTVTATDPNRWGMVELDHGDGLKTKYLHQDSLNVKPGDVVSGGEQIGTSGGRGAEGPQSYVPHAHVEVIERGKHIDPEPFLKSKGIPLTRKGDPSNPTQAPMSDVGLEQVETSTPPVAESTAFDTPHQFSSAMQTKGFEETAQPITPVYKAGDSTTPAWLTEILSRMDVLIDSVDTGLNKGKPFESIREAVLSLGGGGSMVSGSSSHHPTPLSQTMKSVPEYTASYAGGPVASMARTSTT